MPPPRRHTTPHRRPAAPPRPFSPPPGSESWRRPWVQLRSATYHPFIYKRMIRGASPCAKPGDLVTVYDKAGDPFGNGFFNPRSQIALRMVAHGNAPVDIAYFRALLASAVRLRRENLRLDATTNVYRVVHAEGDGLSGLVVDRYDDVLGIEIFSLGIHNQIAAWLPPLHEFCGTTKARISVDTDAARHEGITNALESAKLSSPNLRAVRVVENGVRFAVNFESGQKTGFFCDQRDNRKLFAAWCEGLSVLDVCCYSGGFAIYAMTIGKARDATGIDLDENAIDQARHNANLNQTRVRWVHSDAFTYLRQMIENGQQWDAVVLDPPKLIASREEYEEGRRKYYDLNRLALQVVRPGGLFLTCSCSGRMPREEFAGLVASAGRKTERRLQILRETGAGADHPVATNCPESAYLKAVWTRVL